MSTGRRQFVKFAFFKLDPAWRRLAPEKRAEHRAAFADVIEQWSSSMVIRCYTLVGVRGDVDIMLWLIAEDLDQLQQIHSDLYRTPLGGYLTSPYSYLAITKRSIYVDRYATPEEVARRDIIVPGQSKYLFIYPFVKTRAWYALSLEDRQRMMDEHIRVGRKYPEIKLNTTYSFGIDDQEFVVAFEGDDPTQFVDLVMELRESEASRYTQRDVPTFSCITTTVEGMLESLGGVGDALSADQQAAPAQQLLAVSAGPDGFAPVMRLDDLPPGRSRLVVVGTEQVALFNVDGEILAVSNRCSHSRGPLVDGEVCEGAVTCPWHAARFDLRTGAALSGLARGPIPAFETRVEDGMIFVGPQKQVPATV